MELIDKSAVVAGIEGKINKYTKRGEKSDAKRDGYGMYWGGVLSCLNEVRSFLDTLEVKEINTWHLQKNENIYDAVKDWSLHSFICLMDDGSVQKFTGILSECYDGSVNTHIDATNDEYGVDNIIFWIETPNL